MRDYKKITIVLLRIALGGLFLYSGVDKFLNGFSAAGFLNNATSGPFSGIYMSMAGSTIVDSLVMWGEISIGLALFLGVFVRLASYLGTLMMGLFYLAVLPPEHGFISEHIIYALVFAVLASFGAGRYFGLDKYIEKVDFVKKNKYFILLLG